MSFYEGHASASAFRDCPLCGEPIDLRKQSNIALLDGMIICAKPPNARARDIHALSEPRRDKRKKA